MIQKRSQLISLALKALVIVSALVGIYLCTVEKTDSFMGGIRAFMYFTIQSNLVIAVVCIIGTILLLRGRKIGRGWQITKLVGTVSITLTGAVFCFVLAPTMPARAWSLNNILTHVIVPIAAVLDYFIVGRYFTYEKRDSLWVVIPPLLYVIYAGICYVSFCEFSPGINYPYFFLNWGSKAGVFGFSNELPFIGTGWWILALLFFLICVAVCYILLVSKYAKKPTVYNPHGFTRHEADAAKNGDSEASN